MNLDILKYTPLSTLAVLCLLVSIGCNQADSETRATASSGGFFSGNDSAQSADPLAQAGTDSLFVLNYIKKEPAFKQHAEWMFKFYGDRDYKLAWFRDNELVPETERFLAVIDKASKEGLDPQNYKVVNIGEMLKKYKQLPPEDSARLELQQKIDLALTGSYFNYASDFYRGRVNPRSQNAVKWDVKKNKIKLHKALQTILKERESTYPYYEFEALHKGYIDLREALERYRELQAKGGWTKVELGKNKFLKEGDTAQAVVSVRKRLNPEKSYNEKDKGLWVYDKDLANQVKEFQVLHGLKEDGVVGQNTVAVLNVPIEDRINQIMINMERWRWIPKRMVPKSLDQKFIWVNIPEYKLYIYEDPDNDPEAEREYEEVMSMRVIVGKTMNSTPIFSDKLEYVVMAPFWNVPNSIVEEEIKPKMLENQNWLASQNMEIVTKEKNPKNISPYSINWAGVTRENFTYRVRQKPGPENSLGMIKFLFPNEYAVYLHDTPADALFSQNERDFSHGCVRVEKPVELAKYLLRDMPEWDEYRIRETMRSGEEKWVTLPKRVQVYLVYFTSWVDKQGRVHFREDLYGHDKKLEQEYFG